MWSTTFIIGNLYLNYRENSSMLVVADDVQTEILIKNNDGTLNIAEIMHLFHMSVVRHLKTLGYVNRVFVCLTI